MSHEIVIAEFNFDITEGQISADWLANALFCLERKAQSAKELKNRMRKVSLQNTTSFYDLYKTIKNIVEEQLTAAGVKK